jgi:hypothetical protein
MSLETRLGLSWAHFKATRQPMEWATRVTLVMPDWEQRFLTSFAKEAMLSLLNGVVGERPCPSRSNSKEFHDRKGGELINGVQ